MTRPANAGDRGVAVRDLRPSEPEWTALLAKCRHDFYHLPAYVDLEARRLGGAPLAVTVARGSDFLLLPLVLRPLPGDLPGTLQSGCDATSPYGYPGLLVAGPHSDCTAWLREALTTAMSHLAAIAVASVFVRLHPLLGQPLHVLREFGQVVEHGQTVVIDLACREEDAAAQQRENHRRVLRRLRASGMTARMDESWHHLDDFVRIYHETMEKVHAARWYFFDRAYFEELRAALGDRVWLSLVELDGEVVAAGLFTVCDGIAQYHLGGTADRYRHLSPSRLMFDEVRRWAREHGCRQLHLGGGVDCRADSLFHFKAGFSSGRARFSTWRAVPMPEVFAEVTRSWERFTGLVADPRDGYFPPYRKPPAPAPMRAAP